jgi:hypothetical protein
MTHNLIIYDITFAEKYNVNSIIDIFCGYGFKCYYLKNLNYITINMLTSTP